MHLGSPTKLQLSDVRLHDHQAFRKSTPPPKVRCILGSLLLCAYTHFQVQSRIEIYVKTSMNGMAFSYHSLHPTRVL